MAARLSRAGGGSPAHLRPVAARRGEGVERADGRGHRGLRLRACAEHPPGPACGGPAGAEPRFPVHVGVGGRRASTDRPAHGGGPGGGARQDEARRAARCACLRHLDQGVDLGRGGGGLRGDRGGEVARGRPPARRRCGLGDPRAWCPRLSSIRVRAGQPFARARRGRGDVGHIAGQHPGRGRRQAGRACLDIRPGSVAAAGFWRDRGRRGSPQPGHCALEIPLRAGRRLPRGGVRPRGDGLLQREPPLPVPGAARDGAAGGRRPGSLRGGCPALGGGGDSRAGPRVPARLRGLCQRQRRAGGRGARVGRHAWGADDRLTHRRVLQREAAIADHRQPGPAPGPNAGPGLDPDP